jgi:hypothetical protein
MSNTLTIYEVEKGEAKFYLRGLLVGEYLSLGMSGKKASNDSFWIDIAKMGIVNWQGVKEVSYTLPEYILIEMGEWPNVSEKYCIYEDMPFSKASIDYIDYNILIELGQKIYNEFTMLSEEETDKFIAATRFLHFLSEPANKSKIETFDCMKCIENNYRKNRSCSRFTDEEAQGIYEYIKGLEDEDFQTDEVKPEKDLESLKKKYSTVRTKSMVFKDEKGQEIKPRVEKSTNKIVLDKYAYPECPVSYIPDWINTMAGVFFHCSKSNITFFSGGICDQPYKFYRAERIVASESSTIEREEMDKAQKSNSKRKTSR